MKVIFAGTPEFAAAALESLLNSTHEVIAVYTQPDRPSGRGLKLTPSPVKKLAELHRLPLHQPVSLKDDHEKNIIAGYHADVMAVAAYGILLPADMLNIPAHGCVNIHPSLLPRWRGAAPIQRTICAGDTETGVTIMQMDKGLDTGPVLLLKLYRLAPDETSQTLHDRLAKIGASALIETLDLLEQNNIQPIPQNNDQATYAQKISKEEALIDWHRPAIELERDIRAFNPWPVAYTSWHEQSLRVWSAKALDQPHQAEPRTILHAAREGIDIAAGQGVLRLLQVQLPGGKIMSAGDFFNARQHELKTGEHFI